MADDSDDVPTILKKLMIKDKANDLVYDDRLYVLQILKQHLSPEKIIENADGCRVNLDTLPDELISKIHHIINTRLEIPQANKI